MIEFFKESGNDNAIRVPYRWTVQKDEDLCSEKRGSAIQPDFLRV